MTCAAMFHPLQSYSRTRTHSQNIKTFLLYTIVFFRLSVVAFVCEGSSSAFASAVCAGCSNELLLVDKLLREQMESLISTHLGRKNNLISFSGSSSNVMQHVTSYFLFKKKTAVCAPVALLRQTFSSYQTTTGQIRIPMDQR